MNTTNDFVEGPAPPEQFEVINPPHSDSSGTPEIVEAPPEEHPTESHLLANAEHKVKGVAQFEHGHTEVRDLGWNEDPVDVPVPLVEGLPNEELWTLIRRFNHVCDVASADSILADY
jgi:hypothetical protein